MKRLLALFNQHTWASSCEKVKEEDKKNAIHPLSLSLCLLFGKKRGKLAVFQWNLNWEYSLIFSQMALRLWIGVKALAAADLV